MGVKPYLLASALLCVVAQRLVRRVCPHCRIPDPNSLEQLDKLGVEGVTEGEFFRGEGCDNCYNTGYRGRTGVYEILPVDENIRRLTLDHADSGTIMKEARRAGMKTMLDDGMDKALRGITSLEEIIRVCPTESLAGAEELVTGSV
jgi:type II secretory ATPase GspE/PulE/Tfp pilus assembly ATPase PilB-like protein